MAYAITAQNDNVPCPGWVLDIVTRQRRVFRLRYGRNSSLNDHEVFQAWDYATAIEDDVSEVMSTYEFAKVNPEDAFEDAVVTHMPRMNFQGGGLPA